MPRSNQWDEDVARYIFPVKCDRNQRKARDSPKQLFDGGVVGFNRDDEIRGLKAPSNPTRKPIPHKRACKHLIEKLVA